MTIPPYYPPAYNDTYVKASNSYGGYGLVPYNAADPGLLLTGSMASNSWQTTSGGRNNVRFSIDLGQVRSFSRLLLHNLHDSGGLTGRGINNFGLYGTNSASAFASTDYGDLSDLTLLGSYSANAHVASDISDPQYFTFAVASFRYCVLLIADNHGDTGGTGIRHLELQYDSDAGKVGRLFELPYPMVDRVGRLFELPYPIRYGVGRLFELQYGIRLGRLFELHYDHLPQVGRLFSLVYRDRPQVGRLFELKYDQMLAVGRLFELPYTMSASVGRLFELPYIITEGPVGRLFELCYSIKTTESVGRLFELPYYVHPDPVEQSYSISVTAGGVDIDPHKIDITVSEDQYYRSGSLTLGSEQDFLACCGNKIKIIISVNGEEQHLIAGQPTRSRNDKNRIDYLVPLTSRLVLLDMPHAELLLQEFEAAMASATVATLTSIENIDVDWQMVDWYIPAATLYANNESPLAIIRKIVDAGGGLIQDTPAGNMIVRPLYPLSVTSWATATPDLILTDQYHLMSYNELPSPRDGSNAYGISDQLAIQPQVIIDPEDISSTKKKIKAWLLPRDPDWRVALTTSRNGGTIEPMGEVVETIEDELVEIVNGGGQTLRPIADIVSHNYEDTALGAITWGADGSLTTEIVGHSLVKVTYTTVYDEWLGTNYDSEDVQYILEDVT